MTRTQKGLLWSSSVLTAATGVVYWWMEHMLQPVDEWAVINHPLQPWVLKAHILMAPVLVFAVGLIAGDHIARHLRSGIRLGRGSGMTTLWTLAPMVASGYLLQAVTHAAVLAALSWLHFGTGVLYLVGLVLHGWILRRRRRARARAGGGRWEAVGAPSPAVALSRAPSGGSARAHPARGRVMRAGVRDS